jgi:hypothetical protein
MSRRQTKSFSVQQFFKNAAEVWASSPHLRSKLDLQSVFPAAIAFFETYQFAISWFLWNKLQIQTRQRGNCSTLAGKSRGGTPFCRTLQTVFSKNHSCNVSCETLLLGKPTESDSARLGHIPSLPWKSQLPLKPYLSLQPLEFEGNCNSLQFSLRFLLHFIIRFCYLLRKCGLLAHTSPAFLKNCWIKKLFFCLWLVAYSQSSKKAAASLQEVAAFLQNIPKIKWFVAKLFHTFYS